MNKPQSQRTAAAPSLKGRALRLLAGREHSRLELERKLAVHAGESGELERVLDELQAKGFINEQRVLESVLYRRAERFGLARIAQELTSRGLSGQDVEQALQGLKSSEFERARSLWERRFGQLAGDPRERARQIRFLIGRGFSAEVARRITG